MSICWRCQLESFGVGGGVVSGGGGAMSVGGLGSGDSSRVGSSGS